MNIQVQYSIILVRTILSSSFIILTSVILVFIMELFTFRWLSVIDHDEYLINGLICLPVTAKNCARNEQKEKQESLVAFGWLVSILLRGVRVCAFFCWLAWLWRVFSSVCLPVKQKVGRRPPRGRDSGLGTRDMRQRRCRKWGDRRLNGGRKNSVGMITKKLFRSSGSYFVILTVHTR